MLSLPSFLYPQSSSFSPLPADKRHTIFAFMIPVFVSFIDLKHLNKSSNPYDTYPSTINASIFILLLYCISSIVEAKINRALDNTYVLVCGHISDLSAILVLTLLASIVFPFPLRLFTYIVFLFELVRVLFGVLRWLEKKEAVEYAKGRLQRLMIRISARYLPFQSQDSSLLPISSGRQPPWAMATT